VLANSGNTDGKVRVQHKVKPGEYLHKIAILYGCTVDDIYAWNPNADETLNKGDFLDIWVDKKVFQRIQQDGSIDTVKTKMVHQ
jgi:LysM repeat protein